MAIYISLAHELDAAWIITLWKAIHGGDPSPIEADTRAAELISQLGDHLTRTIGHDIAPLTFKCLEARLQALGIPLSRHVSEELDQQEEPLESPYRRWYSFTLLGERYCIDFPVPLGHIQ